MIERRIKELSIALEALSRINGADAYFQQICTLLQHQIDEAHKENHPLKSFIPPPAPNLTDDIPS